MVSTDHYNKILSEFSSAVALHEGSRLAALFSEDGIYADCFYGVARGRRAIAEMVDREFFATAEDFHWTFHDPVSNGEILYARYAFSFHSREATAPPRVGFEGVSMLTLRDGEITAYREVANSGPMLASLGYAPARLQKILLKDDTRVWAQPEFAAHRKVVKGE